MDSRDSSGTFGLFFRREVFKELVNLPSWRIGKKHVLRGQAKRTPQHWPLRCICSTRYRQSALDSRRVVTDVWIYLYRNMRMRETHRGSFEAKALLPVRFILNDVTLYAFWVRTASFLFVVHSRCRLYYGDAYTSGSRKRVKPRRANPSGWSLNQYSRSLPANHAVSRPRHGRSTRIFAFRFPLLDHLQPGRLPCCLIKIPLQCEYLFLSITQHNFMEYTRTNEMKKKKKLISLQEF